MQINCLDNTSFHSARWCAVRSRLFPRDSFVQMVFADIFIGEDGNCQ